MPSGAVQVYDGDGVNPCQVKLLFGVGYLDPSGKHRRGLNEFKVFKHCGDALAYAHQLLRKDDAEYADAIKTDHRMQRMNDVVWKFVGQTHQWDPKRHDQSWDIEGNHGRHVRFEIQEDARKERRAR